MGESIAEVADYVPEGFMLVWEDGWMFRHRSDPTRDCRPSLPERIRFNRIALPHLKGADHDR